MPHESEELQHETGLAGRILQHRCHGLPAFLSWLTFRGEVLRHRPTQEVANPFLWIAPREQRSQRRLDDVPQSPPEVESRQPARLAPEHQCAHPLGELEREFLGDHRDAEPNVGALRPELIEHRHRVAGHRARRPRAPRGARPAAAAVVEDDHVIAGGKAPSNRWPPKATVGALS